MASVSPGESVNTPLSNNSNQRMIGHISIHRSQTGTTVIIFRRDDGEGQQMVAVLYEVPLTSLHVIFEVWVHLLLIKVG